MTQQETMKLQKSEDDDVIDLGYLLAVCLDHKRTIIFLTLLATAIGMFHALVAPPIYRADALLQVESRSDGLSGNLGIPILGQEQTASTTETEILRSRMILSRAAAQAGMALVVTPVTLPIIGAALIRYGVTRPNFANGWASVWAGETIAVADFEVEQSLMEQALVLRVIGADRFELIDQNHNILGQGQAGTRLTRETPELEILVTLIDAPAGAEFILTRRNEVSMTGNLQSRFGISPRGDTGILQLTLEGGDREELVRSLDAIAEVYLVQNINRQAAEAESRLEFLDQQTPLMLEGLTEAEDSLNNYRASQESVDLSFETQAVLSQLVSVESQLNELEFEEAEIARRFTPSHPTYQSLLDRRDYLQSTYLRLESQIEELPETQRQVLRLNRDVEVSQRIYMQMLNTMQELRIAKAGSIGNVRILDKALASQSPVAPNRLFILVAYLLGGLIFSLLLVTIRKVMRRGVESVDQIQGVGLTVYATVPLSDAQQEMMNNHKTGLRGLISARMTKSKAGHLRKRVNADDVVGGILAWSKPTDLSIEALRGLRTSLHFAMLEAPNNRLMLTGPSPKVGKSFISANLAVVCAQAGQKVLLVDADLRKGHIHSVFQHKADGGLSDLLSGQIAVDKAIRTTKQEGLNYVARGKVPPNPSELLMHANFTLFLDKVSDDYDLVIIDTPPVLAVTDAALVGKQVGTSLLIARFQMNPPKEIERAIQQLESAGVNVKGAIFNAVERTASANYGYGYGYYNYSYQSDVDTG